MTEEAQSVATEAPLKVTDLEIRYPGRREPSLRGVGLEVSAGERVAVAGRTGAGKSTLALAAAGFIPRVVRATVSGAVTIAGVDARTADAGQLLGRVGIVFATPANQLSSSKLTVREELAFGLENLGVPRAEMDARIDAVLERLRIGDLAEREPFSLSGGEQQRVAIASIIAMGTDILVLDEPTAQLDPAGTTSVADLIDGLARSGTTILCAEHAPTVLGRADRCLVLDDGRPVSLDRPGAALSAAGRDVGLRPPTLVKLANVAGVAPGLEFDEAAIAAALAAKRPIPATPDDRPETAPAWSPGSERPPVRVDVEGLVHRYPNGIEAVRGVSLSIEPGEAVVILGQNGSGKTTLVKHLNGLLRPDAGRVLIDGEATEEVTVDRLAATVGFVFQNPDEQLFERSVEREVAFGPKNLRRPAGPDPGPRHPQSRGGGPDRRARDEPLRPGPVAPEARRARRRPRDGPGRARARRADDRPGRRRHRAGRGRRPGVPRRGPLGGRDHPRHGVRRDQLHPGRRHASRRDRGRWATRGRSSRPTIATCSRARACCHRRRPGSPPRWASRSCPPTPTRCFLRSGRGRPKAPAGRAMSRPGLSGPDSTRPNHRRWPGSGLSSRPCRGHVGATPLAQAALRRS